MYEVYTSVECVLVCIEKGMFTYTTQDRWTVFQLTGDEEYGLGQNLIGYLSKGNFLFIIYTYGIFSKVQ